MNDTIEDDVRTAFARVAGPVVPRPDPLGRLLARRRRRRWLRGLSAATATLVLAFGGGLLATAPVGDPVDPSPTPTNQDGVVPQSPYARARMTEWTRRLIAAPIRGNLAGDRAFVDTFTRSFTIDQPMVDPAQDKIKVLAVADVDGGRLAVVAKYNDEYGTLLVNRAAIGTSPETLGTHTSNAMAAPLLPFFPMSSGVVGGNPDASERMVTLALTPAGCTLDSSDTSTIGTDGTPQRTWVPRGDHVIAPGDMSSVWWRVTCDGRVRFEGAQSYTRSFNRKDPSTLAPGRGGAASALVAAAVDAWGNATRHLGGTDPEVMWAGPSGGDRSAVVVSGRAPSGRVLVTVLQGPPADFGGPGLDADVRSFWNGAAVHYAGREPYTGEPMGGSHQPLTIPTWFGTATAASKALVAVRLPAPDESRALLGDRIVVVAPPSATHIRVGNGAPVALNDGVGFLTIPPPAVGVTLTALDATGEVVATGGYTEPDTTGHYFGERVVEDWK